MRNQRGVTLVELLLVIVIMGAIFVPISMMLNISLKTEKEVSIKNDIQREARFIMEYMTEKMRDKDTYWYDDGTNWILSKYDKLKCSEYIKEKCTNTKNIQVINISSLLKYFLDIWGFSCDLVSSLKKLYPLRILRYSVNIKFFYNNNPINLLKIV